MHERDVEILRTFYGTLNRGDLDAALALCDPDVDLYSPRGVVADGTHRSNERVTTYLSRWLENWDQYESDPEQFIEAGDEVVVFTHLCGGLIYEADRKRSRVEIEERVADVFSLQDGRITQLRFYVERDKALEAVGLLP
jgi:ketosteroid isomerase-like protein